MLKPALDPRLKACLVGVIVLLGALSIAIPVLSHHELGTAYWGTLVILVLFGQYLVLRLLRGSAQLGPMCIGPTDPLHISLPADVGAAVVFLYCLYLQLRI
jgi:hypothetical protein